MTIQEVESLLGPSALAVAIEARNDFIMSLNGQNVEVHGFDYDRSPEIVTTNHIWLGDTVFISLFFSPDGILVSKGAVRAPAPPLRTRLVTFLATLRSLVYPRPEDIACP